MVRIAQHVHGECHEECKHEIADSGRKRLGAFRRCSVGASRLRGAELRLGRPGRSDICGTCTGLCRTRADLRRAARGVWLLRRAGGSGGFSAALQLRPRLY